MNGVAESLTAWTNHESSRYAADAGVPHRQQIHSQPVDNPAVRALKEGAIVGVGILFSSPRMEWSGHR